MTANAPADLDPAPDRASVPSLAAHLGCGLAAGVFVAACVAQTMLPHPLDNSSTQIPPNLPLLMQGLGGGLAASGGLWLLRKLLHNRRLS